MGSICSSGHKALEISRPRNVDMLAPGNFVQENSRSFYSIYKLSQDPLGSGALGEIRLCTDLRTGDTRCVKIISKAGLNKVEVDSRSVFREVEILKTLDHPNILKTFEYFEDRSNFYIVMEYCKGGDLFDKVSQLSIFTEKQAAKIMSQVFSGLSYLNSRGVIHRDMKPENVVIVDEVEGNGDDLQIKIIDFDNATFYEINTHITGAYGTTLYMAPEVFDKNYNEKCDMWSCGVILYILLSGTSPFDAWNDAEIVKLIKKGKYSLEGERWANISEDAKDLIRKLLIKDVAKRLNASQAFMHPWCTYHHHTYENKDDIRHSIFHINRLRRASKLKQAIQTFILSQLMKPGELKAQENIFSSMDINGDGVISKEELYQHFKETMTDEDARAEANRIMELVDTDNNGVIDYTEFLRATVEKRKMITKTNLEKTFMIFDKDGSGYLEVNELREWFSGDTNINESLLKEFLNNLHVTEDGKIHFDQFQEYLYTFTNESEY